MAAFTAAIPGASPQNAGQRELELNEIAEIVRAYQESIESLEIRTVTRFVPVAKYARLNTGDPDVLHRAAFASAPGGRAYYFTSREKAGRLLRAADYYRSGDTAFQVEKADVDPNQVVKVTIGREYLGEVGRSLPREDILSGLFLIDGSPISEFLASQPTKCVGRRKIDGADCYEIHGIVQSGIQTPLRAVYLLDPNRDFLCREMELRMEDGELVQQWRTTDFLRVGARWFPQKVIRSVRNLDAKIAVAAHAHTEVEEVRINQKLDLVRFEPDVPDGALVTDTRGDTPVSYIKGGDSAGKRLENRLNALRDATKSPVAPSTGKRIVVSTGSHWLILTASAVAIASGAVLFIAIWLRVVRG